MSRVAKQPITVPKGVEVVLDGEFLRVKGPKGAQNLRIHAQVNVKITDGVIHFEPNQELQSADALAGTMRAVANNMVTGVTTGFERRLQLVGVGYRAQAQGAVLNLALGYSHPINYALPDGVSAETPTQTEIVLKGVDKQLVGQVAAEIRGYRPPEPYKGKGVKYAGETIVRKEAKKK
ncbi:MAG: 50S ribosomal protein L6 [Gammaproteobacteria bacterium 28-57-27]|nr:MAG: 50S ribosomal protein L6 [Gammaproteobacteria bacterium 28-57-27]